MEKISYNGCLSVEGVGAVVDTQHECNNERGYGRASRNHACLFAMQSVCARIGYGGLNVSQAKDQAQSIASKRGFREIEDYQGQHPCGRAVKRAPSPLLASKR